VLRLQTRSVFKLTGIFVNIVNHNFSIYLGTKFIRSSAVKYSLIGESSSGVQGGAGGGELLILRLEHPNWEHSR